MVSITCSTPDSIIRYTLDGNDPTETSTLYEGKFDVTPPVTVKARGFKEGWIESDAASCEVEAPPVPVTVPMTLPDGSILFYDRGASYGEYHIDETGYPERTDGAVDDGSAESSNWRYLICDKSDLNNGIFQWGPNGINEGMTDGEYEDMGYGLPNTNTMIAKYATDTSYWWKAIKEKRDSTGFNWFMPSKVELDMMYDSRTVITSHGGDAFQTDTYYWSSSENDNYDAWLQDFSNGSQNYSLKDTSTHCRLLRRI